MKVEAYVPSICLSGLREVTITISASAAKSCRHRRKAPALIDKNLTFQPKSGEASLMARALDQQCPLHSTIHHSPNLILDHIIICTKTHVIYIG
jgi:hypothetical protein